VSGSDLVGFPQTIGDLREHASFVGSGSFQLRHEVRDAPKEHARVPKVAAGRDELHRSVQIGLLAEPRDGQWRAGRDLARALDFDVTIAGFGPRRSHADHAKTHASLRRVQRRFDVRCKPVQWTDQVVCSEHSHRPPIGIRVPRIEVGQAPDETSERVAFVGLA